MRRLLIEKGVNELPERSSWSQNINNFFAGRAAHMIFRLISTCAWFFLAFLSILTIIDKWVRNYKNRKSSGLSTSSNYYVYRKMDSPKNHLKIFFYENDFFLL